MDESTKINQKVLISFVAGLVLGGGIVWIVVGTEVLSPTVDEMGGIDSGDTTMVLDDDDGTNSQVNGVISKGSNRIVIDNQLEGDRVRLAEIEVAESSWVVVHEEVNSVLGNALGAARFDPGTYTEGYVDLLRNTKTGDTYQVLLYRDDGDKEFNLDDDLVIVDSEGISVGTTFDAIRVDRKTN